VELFWAVDEAISEEASIVLRLVDEKGHLWGQGEQCPFNGLYPMWQWQPGLLLRDEHEIWIEPGTPPGRYQLEVMLVSRPTQEGCAGPSGRHMAPEVAPPDADRGDRVLLGTVDVEYSPGHDGFDASGIGLGRIARFGGLELLDTSLTSSELGAGERLGVGLDWQARAAPLADAQFRLRLVDPAGEVQQESIIRPAGEAYPASRWQAGDRFKGKFWLLLPEAAPGGQYILELKPEPPLVQTGTWMRLKRWLLPQSDVLELASIDVRGRPGGAPAAPATPIPVPTDLAVEHPMQATLGNQIRFLGYEIGDESVRAGEALSFTLYWQALRPMDTSYTIFTHLLGPSGEIIGQKDSVPLGGNYPTTLWQPGEVVMDRYAFLIDPGAPPGDYPLEIGMYRLETAARLPIFDEDGEPVPDDRMLLPTITVLPSMTPAPIEPEARHRAFFPLVQGEP
jgi:hypothetical protein